MRGQRENRFVIRKGYGDRVDLRPRHFDFFGFTGLSVFDGLLRLGGGAGSDRGFIPIVSHGRLRGFGHIILDVDLGRGIGVGAAADCRIDQRERDFGHTGGLAIARPGKDDIFHARAAQGLGRLLAEHPRDGVGDVRLAAAVGANNRRHTVPVELEFGAVAERLEPENLKSLQFEQRELLKNSGSDFGCPILVALFATGWGF